MFQRLIVRTITVLLITSLLIGAGFFQITIGNKINNVNQTYVGFDSAKKVES